MKHSKRMIVPDLRTPVFGLQSPDFGLRSPVSGLRSPDFGLRSPVSGLRSPDFLPILTKLLFYFGNFVLLLLSSIFGIGNTFY